MCLNRGEKLAGRYKIVDRLGSGGFATTYTARDLHKAGKPLCLIKEIPFPRAENPQVLEQARRRFQREATALRTLGQDSRIPELFDSLEQNDNFYLVQEFIRGIPLSQEISPNKQWTEAKARAFLREILEILNYVHQAKIIHRDLKPSNLIRRAKDGKIVLIDFGAVKEISTLTYNSSTGEILTSEAIGTQGYMPAEQYTRSVPQPYNDIYAVGMIAIQALTGRSPINLPRDPDSNEIIWDYSTPARPAPQVSNTFKKISNKMVCFHFINRYQSAAEVLHDLDSLELLPGQDFRSLLWQFMRSNLRWLLLGFGGMSAAFAIALLVSKTYLPSSRNLPPPTLPQASPSVSLDALDGISAGEKLLVQTSALWSKQRGINEFADKNYAEALKLLKQSWRQDRRDPETLIYINNALLKAINAEYYTIAIVVPIRRNPDGSILNANLAEELLRGIAQAQTEVNLSFLAANEGIKDFPGQEFLEPKPMKGKGLRVIIADDANIKSEAIKRANSLVSLPEILAVIGHYTSDMTVKTVDIYDRHKLVALSPGSTTEELTRKPRKFFFRTAPTTSIEAESLVSQLLKVNQKKVVGFYNPDSPFSASLWEEFAKQFEAKAGKTIRIRDFYDLSKNNFTAEKAIEEVNKLGEKTAIVVIPDGQVTNATENAIDMIKFNQNRHWIVGPWTLYELRTLKATKELKSVDKLGVSVFWHPLISFDKKFPINAQKLWGGPVNTRSALTYDAARTLIKALEIQSEPSREGMQTTLADPKFKAEGATGIIEFDRNTGNRINPPKRVMHIVPCVKEIYGVTFVPIEFPTAAAAGLKCD